MKNFFSMVSLFLLMTLFGCGGGGSSNGTVTSPSGSQLSGTVSKGSALPFGTPVTVTDANGVSRSTTVGVNGLYSISVDNLTAPFIIKSGDYYSFANGAGVTNVNPLTDLCVKSVTGGVVPAALPTNFPVQFTAAVNTVLNSLDTMYPANVTATKHFLNGDITLGAGVDLAFDFITITLPNSSGAFSISSGTSTVLSGSVASGSVICNVTPSEMAVLRDKVFPATAEYGMKFTSTMLNVPGDLSLVYYDVTGNYGTLILRYSATSQAGTYRLKPLILSTNDSTGIIEEDTGHWTINSAGQLVLTNSGYGVMMGTVTTLTLTQTAGSSYTAIETQTNTQNAGYHANTTLTLVPTPKFLAATDALSTVMAGGRTIRYLTASGANAIFCLGNGAYSSTDATIGSGTWTVTTGLGAHITLTKANGANTIIRPTTISPSGDYTAYSVYTDELGVAKASADMSFVLF